MSASTFSVAPDGTENFPELEPGAARCNVDPDGIVTLPNVVLLNVPPACAVRSYACANAVLNANVPELLNVLPAPISRPQPPVQLTVPLLVSVRVSVSF